MTLRSTIIAASVASLVLVPSLASAQEDPRKKEAAQLYEEGLKLHDKDKEAEALEKFQKSYAIYPSPNTLVSIAREEQLTGKALDALRHYREALKQPLLNPKNATLAKQYIVELEPKFGRVTVTGPSGTKVTIAGVTARLPMDEPVDVEPGNLAIEGDHDGKTLVGTGSVAAGKFASIELKAKDEPTAVGPATPPPSTQPPTHDHVVEPPPVAPSERTSFWGWRSITGLSLVGVGVIGVGLGFVFNGQKSSKQDAVAADNEKLGNSTTACAVASPPPACDSLRQDNSDLNSASSRTTVSFVAGGIALGVGAAFLASAAIWPHQKDASAARIVPVAGPREAGLILVSDF
jgi:hypothetical protein